MNEIVLNMHMHTRYSDGSGSHRDIASAALQCGLDAVIVTDHNVRIDGMQRYVEHRGRRLLFLVGEEIHDRSRIPQKNHLLVLGANSELSPYGEDTDALLRAIQLSGGLSFIAHPVDPPAPAFHEPDISWEDWSVSGFTGIELWNGFSELKSFLPSWIRGFFLALFPVFVAHGPHPKALRLWDDLLARGNCVAVAGSDAHALKKHAGPVRRTVFPYKYHFRAINTHVLLDGPLSSDADRDARSIYAALAAGRCFLAYDLPKPTRGFAFQALGRGGNVHMGGHIEGGANVTLSVQAPYPCDIQLMRDGRRVHTAKHSRILTFEAPQRGTYRVEAYRRYLGARRTWIISNPIRVH
ncbi:MAG TPA: CehA/McbA family metallohydrolase [Anaerolineales bacterium]